MSRYHTKEQLKEMSRKIAERSLAYYKHNKEACRFHNWLARMYAYFGKGRLIYPDPKKSELEIYKRYFEHNSTNIKKWYKLKTLF